MKNFKPSVLKHHIDDCQQNSYNLSSIQLTGAASLPVLASSVMIRQLNSFWGAVLALVLSFVLLGVIRWVIILTTHDSDKKELGRNSTLDISIEYGGRAGGYCIAIVLLLGTLAWFVAQTTLASNALISLLEIEDLPGVDEFVRVSLVLSFASALLCMEGIIALRKASIIGFPVLIGLLIVCMFIFGTVDSGGGFSWGMVFASMFPVVGAGLGVTADLPTFFRHAGSKRESMRALFLLQGVGFLMGLAGLFLGSVISEEGVVLLAGDAPGFHRLILGLLVGISVVFANVLNIYAASVGWELYAKGSWVGRQEFLILGFGLSLAFILFSNIIPVHILIDVTDTALINLCIIFVVGYLMKVYLGKWPDASSRLVYFSAWLVSTIVNILVLLEVIDLGISPLFLGVGIILAMVLGFQGSRKLLPG